MKNRMFLASVLALVASNAQAYTITWTDNSTNEKGFRIYRAPVKGAEYVLIGETPANVRSFVDPDGVVGNCYRATAWNDFGESAPSAITTASCATVPLVPSNTKAAQ